MKTNMVRPLMTLMLLLLGAGFAYAAQTLLIEGKYQSKNLYVQNAANAGGVGFLCV